MYFSLETFAEEFYRVDGFGPTEADICVHGTPDFLPDEPTADILVHIRHGLSKSQIVDCLLEIAIRAEDGLE